MAERWPRDGREMAERWPRSGREIAEIWSDALDAEDDPPLLGRVGEVVACPLPGDGRAVVVEQAEAFLLHRRRRVLLIRRQGEGEVTRHRLRLRGAQRLDARDGLDLVGLEGRPCLYGTCQGRVVDM